jgi:integrase
MDLTLADRLRTWLEQQRTQLQPSTWRQYAGTATRYLVPHLGDRPMTSITHHDVTALYRTLLLAGGVRGKPLSLATVQRVAAMTHKVFEDAVRDDLLPANPCDKAVLPRIDPNATPRDLRVWTTGQLRVFLDHHRDHPLWSLWVVAAGTGLRRGELLGLRWQDIDLDGGTLWVRRALSVVSGTAQLKLPKSNRTRSLRIGAAVIDALTERRAGQERERSARLVAHESADWGLVFTEPDGGYVDPQKATDTFREAVREAPVPVVRLHDLRHAHATWMLQAGVNAKVVAARLGHASVQTTLDIYAEVLPAMDEEAASRFEDHVWGIEATVMEPAQTHGPSGPNMAG